jgi:hypothetical protein
VDNHNRNAQHELALLQRTHEMSLQNAINENEKIFLLEKIANDEKLFLAHKEIQDQTLRSKY